MDYITEQKKEFEKFKIKRSLKENIEPEEILVDAQKEHDSFEQRLEIPIGRKIFNVSLSVILLALAVLISQTGYMQTVKKDDYFDLAEKNRLRIYPFFAPRGLIYDRNSKSLVNNLQRFNVYLTPQDLPRDKFERETVIEKISFLLDLNPKDVNQKLLDFDFKKQQRIMLASDLEQEKILALESIADQLPSVSLEKTVIRQYPFDYIFSHVLGYTGRLTQEDLEAFPDYFLSERVGKGGLEAEYERTLRGEPGERLVEVDVLGRQIKEMGIKKEIPGQNIITTIDFDLQQKIFQELTGSLKARNLTRGTVIALDPKSGQILSLVNLPSFDNNLFEQSISSGDLNKILENRDQPFFNRAISGQYPPGSTIKPLIGAAALEEKIVTPATTINDPGNIVIVNQYNPSIIYNFPDWKVHGTVNIYSAIAQSCNVYFYTVGGGYGKIEGLGPERIKKYLQLFGLGQALGIDLPGESEGLVPDEEWKERVKGEQWYIGDTYHFSIGQGDLLVTPLQMLLAIAAIANQGKLFEPYLVDKIIDSDKNIIKVSEPRLIRENFISQESLAVIRKGMREAVVSGSAASLAGLEVKIAGKTGTAQVAGQKNPNAWFVGFAPYDNPQMVLVVLVENGGEGSTVAVPIAREILSWYFSNKK